MKRQPLIWAAILCAFSLLAAGAPVDGVWNVRSFGAAGDGATMDTAAIQAALDACGGAGGGVVLLPPGRYLSGTIRLRDRVTLRVAKGAVLEGSRDIGDYPEIIPAYRSHTDRYHQRALIYGEGLTGAALDGDGEINGNGGAFPEKNAPRPLLIRLVTCTDVSVRGLTLRDGGWWTVHFLACDRVLAEGLTIRSRCNRNNDGLDIDSCRGVRVANCDISTSDDAIVMKSTSDRPCRDVVITNCILSSGANAIKTGTESNGGFQQITVSNCVVHDTDCAGIAIETVDGGHVEGITVSGVVMRNTAAPIFIRLGNRARPFLEGGPKPGVGTMRGVILRDIDAEARSPVGSSITGLPGHPVEDITLENVRLRVPGGNDGAATHREVPQQEAKYPEFSMFGTLPAHGLYVRHARGLSLNGLNIIPARPDSRPALVLDDVQGAEIARLRAVPAFRQPALVWVRRSGGLRLFQCDMRDDGPAFLKVDRESGDLWVSQCDLRGARTPWVLPGGESGVVVRSTGNRFR